MATLYFTYSFMCAKGQGIGRNTVEILSTAPNVPPPPKLRLSDVNDIEAKTLALLQKTDPTAHDLFLTNWKWLRDE